MGKGPDSLRIRRGRPGRARPDIGLMVKWISGLVGIAGVRGRECLGGGGSTVLPIKDVFEGPPSLDFRLRFASSRQVGAASGQGQGTRGRGTVSL